MNKIFDDHLKNHYIRQYDLTSYFTKDMSQHLQLFSFSPGDYLYRDGDTLDYFFFFVDGKAKVYCRMANGKKLLLSFYEPLQILGDIEIFNDSKVNVDVKSLSKSYCIGLPINFVKSNLMEDTLFLQKLCKGLGIKLNRCSTNSAINLLYPLENRLASYIMAIDHKSHNQESVLTLYDSLTEISELLGTSYRHLHRTVTNFVSQGILKKARKGYIVIDKSPLKNMAHDLYTNH